MNLEITCGLCVKEDKIYILCALNQMKPLPNHLLCRLYQSFALPIFDYCDAVWAVTSSSISKPLEHLHSHFLRGILLAVHLLNLHSWNNDGFIPQFKCSRL